MLDSVRDVIELQQSHYEEIVSHARAHAPKEACGVVAGREGRAVRVYPMRNADDSDTTYRFEDREQLRVFSEIEDRGWELMAFFHSHPATEAFPSPTDRARAHWSDPETGDPVPTYPGTAYLIVSLRDDEPVLRGFRFSDGDPVEQEVRVS